MKSTKGFNKVSHHVIRYHSYRQEGNSLILFSNSNGSFSKCFIVVQNRVTVTNLQIMFLKLKWLLKACHYTSC